MFLRKHRRKKDGKTHIYWSLVETVRTARGPRQRVVGYLGDINDAAQSSYRRTARDLSGAGFTPPEGDFFSPAVGESPVAIFPERVRVERVRDFGDCFVGVGLWRLLKLDEFFHGVLSKGQEQIAWELMICYLAVARFCEASSKLKIAESYTDRSSLSDILAIDPMKVNKDRLYRAMDQLLLHREALGRHLKARYGELFQLDYELLLYDMTSTYFEGQCRINGKAKRGYSRDQRPDCKQVTLALVVTKEGHPLYFEVFDGNRSDATTVKGVVESVESIYGRTGRVWVMDRGMVSEKNLEWLRERGTFYIVGTPKSMLKRLEQEILRARWSEVEPQVEVKLVTVEDYREELFILCRSGARKEKERAMTELFSERIEKGLKSLSQGISRPQRALQDRDKIQRKIGALLKTNSRAARLFEIILEQKEGKPKLSWKRKADRTQWQDLTAGCYLLRSNLPQGLSAQQMWKAYMNLTEVEEAFRMSKQDLGLRPVWHQQQKRVEAHIFVCFLALVLQKAFEQGLKRCGLGSSARKILQEFQTIKSMDVVMPTVKGDELKLQIISQPEPALKIILDQMALRLPKRLTQNANVVEKTAPYPKENQQLPALLPL